MKISAISNVNKVSLRTAIAVLFALTPLQTQNQELDTFERTKIETLGTNSMVNILKTSVNPITSQDLVGLTIIQEKNFRGGITTTYDKSSIEILKNRIKRDEVKYSTPIEINKNMYLHPFGMFKAKRPGGREHLGLDIFVATYGRKPQAPVRVLAPIEGVVVGVKKANENDNVIANCVTILGVDGRKYAFDHLARQSDFDKKLAIEMPEIGQIVKNGDPLGNVGATGETDMWHLHFVVMSDEQLQLQLNDPKWQEACKKSQYTTSKGQIDPLDESLTGELGKILKSIPIK